MISRAMYSLNRRKRSANLLEHDMTPSTRPAVWRFADRDTVRTADGTTWHRGLRGPRSWAALGSDLAERDDEALRALLRSDPHAAYAPAGPDAYAALPGRPLDTLQALELLDLRPATGAVLHRYSLERAGAFLGSNPGLRSAPVPGLRPADVRSSLRGTAQRHGRARITLERVHGRLHARYAVGSTLHTHTYVLTTS
ncbi:hypothetical protein [Kitasatospora sp. NPDC088783]|uniref:hypothetical protein n=1 Tax=Kitasatospora sp. NPDC088783 TaxID=3364077 RepID=UPI003815985F